VIGELTALLWTANDAVAVPDACGRKVTVKGIDVPTAMIAGKEIPLTTNSALVLFTDETVTGDPLAVRVPASAALDPVATLPKFRVPGASDNCPGVATLPDNATVSCAFEALEEIVSCPEATPMTVGVKTTLKVKLCPAERLAGSDRPLTAKAAFDVLACEIETPLVPVFVKVALKDCDSPAKRLPKLKAAGEAEICPAVPVMPEPVNATTALLRP
jgi:hypothetical protein